MRSPVTRCSMCNLFESHDHPILCKDIRRQSLFYHHANNIKSWLHKTTSPELSDVIYSIITITHRKERNITMSILKEHKIPPTYMDIVNDVIRIGTINFLRGFLPLSIRQKILTMKDARHTTIPSKLVNKLHSCQHDCWLQRNKHLHEHQNHSIANKENSDTAATLHISQLYQHLKRHKLNHTILKSPLEDRQQETTKSKQDWIEQLQPVIRNLKNITDQNKQDFDQTKSSPPSPTPDSRHINTDPNEISKSNRFPFSPSNQSILRQIYPQYQIGRPPD